VPGVYTVSYTATVDTDATGTVGNNVVPSGGGDPTPDCPSCSTSHPLADPAIVVGKSADPASGTNVTAGQTITYTLTATVSDAALSADLVLSDTLGTGLTFAAVTNPGAFTPDTTAAPLLTFTLPSGTVPGVYTVSYTATVDTDATGTVGNNVVPSGGGDPTPDCPSCSTSHPVLSLQLAKNVLGLDSTGPGTWRVDYEIVVENPGAVPAAYTLIDTLGFTVDGVVPGGTALVSTDSGTLAPGLVSGQFTPQIGQPVQLSASSVQIAAGQLHRYFVRVPFGLIDAELQNGSCTGAAGNGLFNHVRIEGDAEAVADACASVEPAGDAAIRLIKTVQLGIDFDGDGFGDVGDVLFYEFEIRNSGSVPLSAIQLVDLLVEDLDCAVRASDGERLQVIDHDGMHVDDFERGGLGVLNPGATVLCSASHELTAADVARRRVENTATVLGTSPLGAVVSSVSTAVYTSFQ
jgi:fimbrial isopeptide formation D2 family protein/uncharacterized repeat protein (TIGR01451 family)